MSPDDKRPHDRPSDAKSVRRAGRIDVGHDVYEQRRRQQARRRAKQEHDQFDPAPPDDDDWTVPDEGTDGLRRVGPPTSLGETLSDLIDRRGWGERLGASRAQARWTEIVGEQLAGRCEPVRLAGGTLVVRAATPAWATQLRYLMPQLLENAARVLGSGAVREIKITVGDLEQP